MERRHSVTFYFVGAACTLFFAYFRCQRESEGNAVEKAEVCPCPFILLSGGWGSWGRGGRPDGLRLGASRGERRTSERLLRPFIRGRGDSVCGHNRPLEEEGGVRRLPLSLVVAQAAAVPLHTGRRASLAVGCVPPEFCVCHRHFFLFPSSSSPKGIRRCDPSGERLPRAPLHARFR